MSLEAKRILLAIGCLIAWYGFITAGGTVAQMVIAALAGWYMGGLIYHFTRKVFPNEREGQA